MIQRIVKELQTLLVGEVSTQKKTREYFSVDGGIFHMMPKIVIYPQDEDDIVELLKYIHELAYSGVVMPITARGKGTDQGGGALTNGISLILPAHMTDLLEIKKNTVVVQPGMNYKNLQDVLKTQDRFLPPYPSSIEYCTIGGSVANNAGGEKSLKYGKTDAYVESLRIVLSNGDTIITKKLNKKQLAEKLSLQNFEGEIYRKVNELLDEHWDLIQNRRINVTKNSAGYNVWDVIDSMGNFDLTPLFVGSQGTLGIITEIELRYEKKSRHTSLVAMNLPDLETAAELILELRELGPSALEMVDKNLLEYLDTNHPKFTKGLIPSEIPALLLLVEFDNLKLKVQDKLLNKALKIAERNNVEHRIAKNSKEADAYWKIRRGAAAMMSMQDRKDKALPIIEDGAVAVEKMPAFLNDVYAMLKKNKLKAAIWGHGGDANFHMQPYFDLAKTADRKKVFKVMDEFYKIVMKHEGSISGEHNDGLLRGKYLKKLYGKDLYNEFINIKKIFDPKGILNPLSKTGAERVNLTKILRREYNMDHLSDHLPHIHE